MNEDDFCKENSGEESLSCPLFGVAQQTPTAGERAGRERAGETQKSDPTTSPLTDIGLFLYYSAFIWACGSMHHPDDD